MTRSRLPEECKIAEQRLAIACDAAGISQLVATTSKSGKTRTWGIDRCSYSAYDGPEGEERARNRGELPPGKPVIDANVDQRCIDGAPKLHAFIEIRKNSAVGNKLVFKPGKEKGSYIANWKGGDEGFKQAWKNADKIVASEKLIDPISPAEAGKILGVEGLDGDQGTGMGNGYVYGFNRYYGYLPALGSKREAIAFGKRWKENIDALVKKVS